eukprot:m.783406 g.783406  ORF g.783406 m.783406 type:complete len:300 (+) comp23294_c0_seq14:224-1123(+)
MLGTHGAVRARDIHSMCPGQYMPRGTIKRVVFHNDICRQYRCAARCKLDTSTSSARCQRRLCHSANAVATNNLPPKVWSGVAHTATVRGAMLEQINAIGSHEGVPGVLAEDGRHAIRRCAQPKDLHGTTTTTRTAIPRRACVHVDEIVVSQHTPERETKRLHHHPPCKRIASDNLASDAARHGHHRGNSNVGVKRRLQVQDSLGRIVRVDAEPNHQPSLPHPRAADNDACCTNHVRHGTGEKSNGDLRSCRIDTRPAAVPARAIGGVCLMKRPVVVAVVAWARERIVAVRPVGCTGGFG